MAAVGGPVGVGWAAHSRTARSLADGRIALLNGEQRLSRE
jgi:hypothetical protein